MMGKGFWKGFLAAGALGVLSTSAVHNYHSRAEVSRQIDDANHFQNRWQMYSMPSASNPEENQSIFFQPVDTGPVPLVPVLAGKYTSSPDVFVALDCDSSRNGYGRNFSPKGTEELRRLLAEKDPFVTDRMQVYVSPETEARLKKNPTEVEYYLPDYVRDKLEGRKVLSPSDAESLSRPNSAEALLIMRLARPNKYGY